MPAATGMRRSRAYAKIKARFAGDAFDFGENVFVETFLGHGSLARTNLAGSAIQVFVVQSERGGAEHDVERLHDDVVMGTNFGDGGFLQYDAAGGADGFIAGEAGQISAEA